MTSVVTTDCRSSVVSSVAGTDVVGGRHAGSLRLALTALAGNAGPTPMLREGGPLRGALAPNRALFKGHLGGTAMGVAPIAASAASPRARSAPPASTSVRAHW